MNLLKVLKLSTRYPRYLPGLAWPGTISYGMVPAQCTDDFKIVANLLFIA